MRFLAYTHANPLIQGSGGEKYLQGLLEKLVEKGDEAFCLCSNENKKWKIKKFNGVEYEHECNLSLHDAIVQYKPDYVITQFFSSQKAIKMAHTLKIKVIYIIHNDFDISTGYELGLLYNSDIALFNTFWICRKMVTRAKKCVIHPIIKIKEVKQDRKYITLINPTKQKGSQIFYSLVINNPDKEFLAVGGGYGVQTNFKAKNLKRIENTQKIFEDVYAKTKILMMPSLYESYGMCAAEAAGCGIPVICSKTAGLRECLGESGILVNSIKWPDWNKKLSMLDDKIIYNNYAEAVKKHFDEDKQRNEELFNSFYKLLK